MPRARRFALSSRKMLASVSLAVAATVALPVAVASPALAAPATPQFGSAIDTYAKYDAESSCESTAQPGVADFRALVRAAYPGKGGGDGIVRACSSAVSEHEEGRAWDFMLNAANPADRAIADDLLGWLLATDEHGNRHANMRRLGIMYMIWDRQIFKAYQADRGWQPYNGASPHTDHIHFSFSRTGAAQSTSWWRPLFNRADYAPTPGPRGLALACPTGTVEGGQFTDVAPGTTHAAAVDCVAWWGVAAGRTPTEFAPTASVSRAQMAMFLARLVTESGGTLPSGAPDAFRDDDNLSAANQQAVNALAAAGIVKGRAADEFDPSGLVSRAQMASFLAATYEYRARTALASGADYFADDDGSVHEASIGKVARAGVTGGTSPALYNPTRLTSRQEMASFLGRLLDLLVASNVTASRA